MAIHAVIVVAFSRIYLTLHYPTDIFGGAVVGFAISILLIPVLSKAVNKSNLLELVDKNPQYSYPFLFLFLMQISTMFTSARELAKAFVSFVT